MTDLAIPEQQQNAPAVPVQQSPLALPQTSMAVWAHEADLAYQLADRLSTTSFIPSTMRGRVGDITACLLAGNELGLKPMAALKSMDVIQGVPALRAHAMRGLVQSHGHKLKLVESTPEKCVYSGKRRDEDDWQTVTWTIPRAALLGLTGKSEWKKQPQTMLVARATGEICRLIASDVLHAVPYTSEELRDTEPRWSAAHVGAPATAAEILGSPAPTPQDDPEQPAEAELGIPADSDAQRPPTAWELSWEKVVAQARRLDWDKDRTLAEFAERNNFPVSESSNEHLDEFAEYLRALVAAGVA
ncbi:hypothetical protein [Streptacidiphilus cavernicola]|uniref:Recombinase RecT n=1 Tax=Streptacidiphilus cavernicola TaxID=3342716 RepID=A0ABV6W4X8_9ACTN